MTALRAWVHQSNGSQSLTGDRIFYLALFREIFSTIKKVTGRSLQFALFHHGAPGLHKTRRRYKWFSWAMFNAEQAQFLGWNDAVLEQVRQASTAGSGPARQLLVQYIKEVARASRENERTDLLGFWLLRTCRLCCEHYRRNIAKTNLAAGESACLMKLLYINNSDELQQWAQVVEALAAQNRGIRGE